MWVEITAHGLQCAFLLRPTTSIMFACINACLVNIPCLYGDELKEIS